MAGDAGEQARERYRQRHTEGARRAQTKPARKETYSPKRIITICMQYNGNRPNYRQNGDHAV
ncbi:uncharacterized protein FRV6_16977 [Fusarium oxysporum]|uniref:Uncharacterized protein n=1 Tax=Fusarium oxysporum TaxID=5507 RepID=A0A2H3UGC6_FUSOX|nr:uncharacterized protein FRV6_16977 [Fusarium oxysporum]